MRDVAMPREVRMMQPSCFICVCVCVVCVCVCVKERGRAEMSYADVICGGGRGCRRHLRSFLCLSEMSSSSSSSSSSDHSDVFFTGWGTTASSFSAGEREAEE